MTDLRAEYEELSASFLNPCAQKVEKLIADALHDVSRVDRISSRVKATDRFVAKAQKEIDGTRKYNVPILEIHDVIGEYAFCS